MRNTCLNHRVRRATLLLTFMAGYVVVALGQTQFGSISGLVTDPTGANVPNVAIRATNEATNTGFSTTSTPAGDYLIDGLLPGVYTTVSGTKTGFTAYRVTGVTVVAGQGSRADLHLAVGATSQGVTVKAEAGTLGTESAEIGDHVLTSYVQNPATIQIGDQSQSETAVMELQGHFNGGGRSSPANGDRSYDRVVTLDGSVFGISSSVNITEPRGSVTEGQAASLNSNAEYQTTDTNEMFTAKSS